MQALHIARYAAQLVTKLPVTSLIFKLLELFPSAKAKQRSARNITLPTEVVMMIFAHLSQSDLFAALLVSKEWSTIAVRFLYSSPTPQSIYAFISLSTVLGYDDFTSAFTYTDFISSVNLQYAHLPSLIRKLAKLLEMIPLSSVNLSNQVNMEDRIVNQLLARSSKIKEISLNATGVRTLQFLANNLAHLEKLELAKCIHVTNNGLRNIGLNCRSLATLNLSGSFIDDATLTSITESCLDLKILDLSDCFHLTDQSFISLFLKPCADLITLAIPVLIVTLNSLEIISNANNNNAVFKLKSITFTAHAFHPNKDDAISLFASVFPRIEYISLVHCNITDAVFDAISFHCTQLKQFKIDYEPTTTNTQTQMYSSNFRRGSLDRLCTKRVFVDGLEMCVDSGIQLESLSLPYCHLPLRPISNLSRILSASLCSLNISSCGSIIDDAQIECVSVTCPLISTLDLSFCHALTDTCVGYLARLSDLRILNLSVSPIYCFQLTSKGLNALLSSATSIKDLSIVVDPQNASISRLWEDLDLKRYFGSLPLGDSFNQIVSRDRLTQIAMNAIHAEAEVIDDVADQRVFTCTLSPIDILELQHRFTSTFIHMAIIQNPGHFQYSFVKWRRLLDDFTDRKLLLSDILFKAKLSFQNRCKEVKKSKKECNSEWRCVMCVVVGLRVRGWCPGVIGSIAALLVE